MLSERQTLAEFKRFVARVGIDGAYVAVCAVLMRRSINSPSSVRMQTWLEVLCTSIPICSMAGLHFPCGNDRVNLWS